MLLFFVEAERIEKIKVLIFYIVLKSNERSEDSYIGPADFFFRKKS